MRRHALVLEPAVGDDRGTWIAVCRCRDWRMEKCVDLNTTAAIWLQHATSWEHIHR